VATASQIAHLRAVKMAQSLFLCRYVARQHLHSFPTRRSSDLAAMTELSYGDESQITLKPEAQILEELNQLFEVDNRSFDTIESRSEEHTSELQSRFDLVCRLLLEKKNKVTSTQEHN